MLQQLCVPNAYFYSQALADQPLVANSYLFVMPAGNVLIDPLPLDDQAHSQIEHFGGISRVLVMIAEREPVSQTIAARYGATITSSPEHRERLFPGAIAIRLPNQRREHEFAVSIPEHSTMVVGDSVLGSPAGALSMPSDDEYADVRKAALGLRRILGTNPETLLVGYGQSIFVGAFAALYRLLYARAGAEVHRINVDELEFQTEPDEPARFRCLDAEVGFTIGARKLGYRVSTLEPGQCFCPLHSHAREEEMFLVLEGGPSVRTLSGTIHCRKGDFIALPVGETGTHQLLNESDAPATVLLLGRSANVEACYYPDSDKLLIDTTAPMINGRRSTMVKGSPDLDYFHGE